MSVSSPGAVDPNLLATMNGTSSTTTNTTQDTQNNFLNLLVTQMQNQDPLNPMDNAEITSQLAQLSTVTGIDNLNSTVVSLGASLQSSQILQAAGMINHGVLAAGSAMVLAKTSSDASATSAAIYGVQLPQDVSGVTVTIKDSTGAVVSTQSLGAMSAGVNALTWDGKTNAGTTAPDGAYTFEVAATSAGKSVAATSLGFGVVSSVASGTSGVKLSVANIGEIGLSDIMQVY